ncbi:hypothetical protein B9N43_16315 [Denitratisoma sp. DHT3]|uniref:FecR family protein n=1 Tax=Denitratisoma sp. DHT3 TaxID=1981880 RepID=UPI001198AC06|nr:FecR domain-containing protein [Denitratisoma sp. DHT3]QDX82659.1 hypothetical protein B9N43_16315 [Denitratisoma sp. DHT3]
MFDWLRAAPFRRLPASAEEWAVRMQAGDLGRHELRAFDAWLKASPANAQDYARCNKVAYLASRLAAHPERVRSLPAYVALQRQRREDRGPAWRPLALAGAACLVLALAWLPPLREHWSPAPAALVTAHGEQRQVPLRDGTRLHINTDTEVTLDLSGRERRVILGHGEVFFSVAKDPRRPFVVAAGDSEVRVLGTKFSVRRIGGDMVVVVAEGRVAVRPDRAAEGNAVQNLVAGQKLLLDAANHRITVSAVDAERATAWRSGQVYFEAATLEQVVADVNRYTLKQFVIDDATLKSIRLSGNFHIGDTDSVKFVLKRAFAIEASEQGNKILLRAARPASPARTG